MGLFDFGNPKVNGWMDNLGCSSFISKDFVSSMTGTLLTAKRFNDDYVGSKTGKGFVQTESNTDYYLKRGRKFYEDFITDLNRISIFSEEFRTEITMVMQLMLHDVLFPELHKD